MTSRRGHRIDAAIRAMPEAPEPIKKGKARCESAINNEGESSDEEELELTAREVKQLKREARKRKWVRRCRLGNNYLHALCKYMGLS